jgi:hypothetical protein
MSLPSVRKELELDVTDDHIRGSWPRRMKAKVMELALEAQDQPGNNGLLIANNGAAKLVRCNRPATKKRDNIPRGLLPQATTTVGIHALL